MKSLVKISLKSLTKNLWFSLLTLIVCVVAMQTITSAITNASGIAYQKAVFRDNFALDMDKVLHLNFKQTDETPEFARTIRDYLEYIEKQKGVISVGQFDTTGVYFKELKENEQYVSTNQEVRQSRKYKKHPNNSQIIYIDESVLSLIKGGITEYAEVKSNALPIYVSEIYQEIIEVGDMLTEEYTGTVYEVAGYIPNDTSWPEENDIIRYPMVTLDCCFVAPYSDASRLDIMEQLSSLHNTYVILSEDADVNELKTLIFDYPEQHGFKAKAFTINEEYDSYTEEMKTITIGQLVLAVFISVMALSSVVSIFTTNAMLKKKYYGVLVTNGFTLKDIIKSMSIEIFIIVFISSIISWVLKLREFVSSTDLFREVYLIAHYRYTLPLCLLLVVFLTGISVIVPSSIIKKYQPCELLNDGK